MKSITIGDFIQDIYLYPDKVGQNQEFPTTLKAYIYYDNYDSHFMLFKSSLGEWRPGGAGNFWLYLIKATQDAVDDLNIPQEIEQNFYTFITDKKELQKIEKAVLSRLDDRILDNQEINIYALNKKELKEYLKDKRRKSEIQRFFKNILSAEKVSIIPQKFRILNKNTGEIYFRLDYEFRQNPLKLLKLKNAILNEIDIDSTSYAIDLLCIIDYDKYVFNLGEELTHKLLRSIKAKTIYIMGKPESEKILKTCLNLNLDFVKKIVLQLNQFEYESINKSLIDDLRNKYKDKFLLITTLGKKGVMIDENIIYEQPYKIKKNEINTSGAGDVFGAYFISYFVLSKYDLKNSIYYGFDYVSKYLQKINNIT